MSADCFVDTNVFVYARDTADPDKQARAYDVVDRLWETRRGRVSVQVLQELYVTVTRKLAHPLTPADARQYVRTLGAWRPVAMEERLLEMAWRIGDRYRLSWWDSLIVAAARGSGCRWLVTEDLQDGQDLGGLEVVDPFRGDALRRLHLEDA
ncbi:MAG: PIN domain-containing protein [Myxococcota bacterium]